MSALVAGCQEAPLSVETSTLATLPPPTSADVPEIVVGCPAMTVAPEAGELMTVVGADVSVDAVARVRPDMSVAGWIPMSAKRLTVACCMLTSTGVGVASWYESRPHDHCTLAELNTCAPLGAR